MDEPVPWTDEELAAMREAPDYTPFPGRTDAARIVERAVQPADMATAAELMWWRQFASKFGPGNLPPVGTPLTGTRFVLMYDDGHAIREWRRR